MLKNVFIELTNICDMACEYCSNSMLGRPRRHMDFDLFTHIIDDIKANRLVAERIFLYAIGESLLYPRLVDAVAYCKNKGFKITLFTNGLRLTPDIYRKLVDSGLEILMISFNDLSADSFAYRHVKYKMTYSAYFKNLIDLVSYHVKNNLPSYLFISTMHCKREWISSELWDLPAIKSDTRNAMLLWQPLINEMRRIAKENNKRFYLKRGILWFNLRALNIFQSRLIRIMDKVLLRVTSLSPELFKTRKKIGEELGKKIKLVKRTKGYCLCDSSMIFSDGSITPCTDDGLGELTIGKITRNSPLSSVINSEKYKSFVSELRESGNFTRVLCQECKGTLVYRNPIRQTAYLIRAFNIYAYISKTFLKTKQKIKEFLRKWIWNKLTEQKKNRISKVFRR